MTPEDIAEIVRAGLLAPSGDNCQPWQFSWDGHRLTIGFVRERAASLYDVRNAASWIALGATLTNMQVAARERGAIAQAALFPHGTDEDRVAALTFERAAQRGDVLSSAISVRCVNRRPYHSRPLAPHDRDALQASIQAFPEMTLDWLEAPDQIARAARIAALNERVLFENRPLHDGLFQWIRWTGTAVRRTGDGMPIGSLELGRLERAGFCLLSSWMASRCAAALGLARMLPSRTQQVYRRCAAIGLLSAPAHDPETFVQGGSAIELLWLTTAQRGIAFQPITGLTCLWWRCRLAQGAGLSPAHQRLVEDAARRLGELLPAFTNRTPVMLFRIGYANSPTARAIRRPLEAVLTL